MRIYLEAKEQTDLNPEFARLDVTNKSQVERDAILVLLKDYMTGLTCKFTRHNCYHDVGKSCEAMEV